MVGPVITYWLDTSYASLMYAVDQLTLAGGAPYDAWELCAEYVAWHDLPVTCIAPLLEHVWQDVTNTVCWEHA